MYGANIGSLDVFTLKGTTKGKTLWTKSASQGNQWIQAELDLPVDTYQVVLEATRGRGGRGDIAIDDTSMKDGPCKGKNLTCKHTLNYVSCYDMESWECVKRAVLEPRGSLNAKSRQ